MKISDLIKDINGVKKVEGLNKDIKHLAYNTSDVISGSLFFCIEGVKTDGHLYANKAAELGAEAIVISKDVIVNKDITKIFVNDTREAMALISGNFYNNPGAKMDIIGITGTNGKTTSTFMMKSILDCCGKTTGLLGTIYNISGSNIEEAKRTTPESMDLQKVFSRMNFDGVNSCIMEISSHSLELKRVYGVKFKIGIFTNLTQDHLDFHGNMENYFKAKLKLFDNCELGIINIDDEYGRRAAKLVNCSLITYGIENKGECDIYAEDIVISGEGSNFTLCYRDKKIDVRLSMPGKFNVYNALGCAAAAASLGISLEDIKRGLEGLEKVPGRSEKITTRQGVTLVIDYAHSPDGIINILKTAREYTEGKLYILFGCGGDRDITKRSIMGRAAGELADFCIITSDNPRSEDPIKIINDILPGIEETKCPHVIIPDRKEALKYAIENTKSGDVVIIAGKGHETYQILKDRTIHFDEREIVHELLKEEH